MGKNDDGNNPVSTDASKQILGFEYQKLLAIECCLDSSSGDIVYLECKGDVANTNTIYETKHHCNISHLTEASPDFWKTLRNFVIDFDKMMQYSRLILYTTSSIGIYSAFDDWNKKTASEKLLTLESIKEKSHKTIKSYTDVVFGFNDSYRKKNLLDILNKLEIHSSQSTIYGKYEDIKKKLYYVQEKYRDDLLKQLHGYVDARLIENTNCWHIVYDDFERDLQGYVRKYSNEKIPFPEEPTDIQYEDNQNYRFIDKLKEVDLDKEIPKALTDFLKGDIISIKLIEYGGPATHTAINNFEVDLCDKMKTTKRLHSLKLLQNQLSLNAILQSKELYYTCSNFEKMRIDGVQDIRRYYQHGKMHKIVDEGLFEWKFEEDTNE